VRGRIDLRDEQPKIVAMDVRRPVLSATDSEPLRIALPISVLTDDTVERLKEILTAHPGSSRSCCTWARRCCALPAEFNVATRNGLMGELKMLLGRQCPGGDAKDWAVGRRAARRLSFGGAKIRAHFGPESA